MNPEVKQAWLTALRSGDYKQGRFVLRSKDNDYCCLGVLCDIHAKETGNQWTQHTFADGEPDDFFYADNVANIPYEVETWSGLINTSHLMGMNDRVENTFSQIADYIEENL
jgi:hypothetical protein